MDEFLKAIAALYDPSRVMIVAFLHKYGKSCVCELQESLKMTQSRISRHLKILKDGGFVDVDRIGAWAYYYLCAKSSIQETLIETISKLEIEVPKKVSVCELKKGVA